MDGFAFHAATADGLRQDRLGFLVRLRTTLTLSDAWVRSEPDNEQVLEPMRRLGLQDGWSIWEARLRLDPSDPVTRYAFKLLEGGRQCWLSEVGLTPYFPERDLHYRLVPDYQPARWVWPQVFYQIFPERFCDGDESNNVQTGEYRYEGKPVVAKDWHELPDKGQGAREFFGGDLQGVRQKLPYLEDLGVTALYLNPIFASPSSHKYDTADYYRVDPHFGGDAAFADLCVALRERGMRIILDAVVNHTSERHPWFDRYGEHPEAGAYRSSDSATRDFYTFASDDPESYHGWYGVKTLPVLNYSNPELRRRIYEADDAVLRYWLRPPYLIDGWRFDVIHMLGEGLGARNNALYVRHFRDTLRQENPEAYLLGEHFFEATKWLQGDQEDASMNYYGFTRPVTEFLAGVDYRGHGVSFDAETLAHLLGRAKARLPFPIQLSQFNLLDSHDTPRLLTMLKGDKALFKLAVTLLFTYIGVPCVYYGDEIGLEGGADPDCRRPFPWDEEKWDSDLRAHYQTLIRFRKSSKTLQQGAYLELYAEGDAFAFARLLGEDAVVTLVNRGAARSVTLPIWKLGSSRSNAFVSLWDGTTYRAQGGELRLELPAKSSLVLHREKS